MASLPVIPYAFMVFAVALRAVSTSVKPATARCAELSSIWPRSSMGTDADSAEYAASASVVALMPVALDRFRIEPVRPWNAASVPVKRVFAFAMADSNSDVLLMASLTAFPKARAGSAAFRAPAKLLARVFPLLLPALSASPFNTSDMDPEIPSADGTICTYAFPRSGMY